LRDSHTRGTSDAVRAAAMVAFRPRMGHSVLVAAIMAEIPTFPIIVAARIGYGVLVVERLPPIPAGIMETAVAALNIGCVEIRRAAIGRNARIDDVGRAASHKQHRAHPCRRPGGPAQDTRQVDHANPQLPAHIAGPVILGFRTAASNMLGDQPILRSQKPAAEAETPPWLVPFAFSYSGIGETGEGTSP